MKFIVFFLFFTCNTWAVEPLLPIAAPTGLDEKKIALGKRLFHETKLSVDNSISCASCHSLDTGGVDGLARSFGVNGAEGGINTPTVFNSALNFRQFWNGRAADLEEQAGGPITNPIEMGNTWANLLKTLRADKYYPLAFTQNYIDGITEQNVRHAIAEFERSLTLTNARFDQYLRGDMYAINSKEKRGYQVFKDYGCVACHQGAAVGGNMFQYFGIMDDYFKQQGRKLTDADLGRLTVTNNPADKHVFKVPSLRMVVDTAPYFHDGSAKTLLEAIQTMSEYQLGREIPLQDASDIEAFLGSLKGVYQQGGAEL